MTMVEGSKWYERFPLISWIVAGVRYIASFSDVDLEKAGVMRGRYQDSSVTVEPSDFKLGPEDPTSSTQ